MFRSCFISLALTLPALAGNFPPAAGVAGTTAIYKDDSRFVNWASGYLPVQYGTNVDATWKTPAKALGKAVGDSFDIVCLGDGGNITLYFPFPIRDGAGPDFAVFENSFNNTFLELGYVEVSSDGVNFVRFPNTSLTPAKTNSIDATNIDGLAGKYKQGYGTPFDLSSLPPSPLLDLQNVRFVRIVDIIGDGRSKDSAGNPIFDPYPNTGSAGFDLDAIGVINQNTGPARMLPSGISGGTFVMKWETNPGASYRIESSPDFKTWTAVETVTGSTTSGQAAKAYALANEAKRFWRVVRVDP